MIVKRTVTSFRQWEVAQLILRYRFLTILLMADGMFIMRLVTIFQPVDSLIILNIQFGLTPII